MRLLRGLAVLTLLSVACSSPSSTRGVRVDALDTDIGLGVEVIIGETPAPPPARASGPAVPPQLELPPLPPIEPPPPPILRECPFAGPFDFPAIESPPEPNPRLRPAVGAYPWMLDGGWDEERSQRVSGTVATEGGPEPIEEFETRQILGVEDDSISPEAFRYRVSQRNLLDDSGGRLQMVTDYLVVPDFPTIEIGPTADVGRGVFIAAMSMDTRSGLVTFEPAAPVQILAFPVVDGDDVISSGLDPTNLNQLTIQGEVNSHLQVDACGERVDTWLVDSELTFTYTDPTTFVTQVLEVGYSYGIGVQFGSMILYERLQAPRDIPVVDVEARIGLVPEQVEVL